MRRKRGRSGKHRESTRSNPPRHAGQETRPPAGTDQAEAEAGTWQRETGYRPSVNQARHEPMPASRHAPAGQEAEVRSAQHAVGKVDAWPSGKAPAKGERGDGGQADRARAG